ncbi:MAG: glycerate kinase [Cyanobacteria bacterium J06649_4]
MNRASADSQTIWPIIVAWGKGYAPGREQRQKLYQWALYGDQNTDQDEQKEVWLLSTQEVDTVLTQRAELLQKLVQHLDNRYFELPLSGDWTDWVEPLWRLWIPLAQRIDKQQRALGQPFVQGVVGGQGTGKTTLSRVLRPLLKCLGHHCLTLSIDDLYLSYAARCQLCEQDARLIWRGPPGTHDVALGMATLAQIKSATAETTVSLPRFDKSLHQGQGDRTSPLLFNGPTVLIFEGWFVGAQPLADDVFTAKDFVFPPPIVTPADRQFAIDCNARLREYLPLWDFLDSLIVLKPQDYKLSLQWRQQAEQAMIATGKSGLSDDDIASFVTYFWKALHPQLFIEPLTQSEKTSLVVNIDQNHCLGELSVPLCGHSASR